MPAPAIALTPMPTTDIETTSQAIAVEGRAQTAKATATAMVEATVQAALIASQGRISFSSDRNGNFEIYVMNTDGSDQTNLTNNSAADYNLSWSP